MLVRPNWTPKLTPSQRAVEPPKVPRRTSCAFAAAGASTISASDTNPARLSLVRQIIEAPAQADARFMRGYVLESRGAERIAAGRDVADIEVAIADVDHEIVRNPDRNTGHAGPTEIPLVSAGAVEGRVGAGKNQWNF